MPNEERINKLTTIFQELGSNINKGSARIVPNNEVLDDSPADLPAGYIKVKDELGYTIPAVIVANLIVLTGQFVNLLYVEGTEPIAFQQGSKGDTNVALWQLVGGTGPDIYYDNGKVGIGTVTIPHGGVGWAQLAIDGPDWDVDGPHIQLTTDVDDYPVMQILGGTHDEVGILFDCYYDGSWRSSNANGNFKIMKDGGRLRFNYDTGIAQGDVITWNQGIALDDNGRTGFGTISPSAQIDSNSSSVAQLRLSHTLLDKFTNFTVDTNHHLTIDPSSTGQIKLNATVTIIDEIQHEGDPNTTIGFDTDKQTFTVGGLVAFQITNTAQDLVEIGDVAGGGDVDVIFNNGQMFLQGNDGRLGIATTGPDAKLDILATITQLRLTHTDGSKFVDFTLDTNHDLTIKPSSTGQVIFQPTTDSIDFFQVLDADGGMPVLNVDATNERVGTGTAEPFQNVAGGATDLTGKGIHIKSSSLVRFILEGDIAAFNIIDTGGGVDDKIISVAVRLGVCRWLSSNDDLTTRVDNIFVMDMDSGNIGCGIGVPIAQLHVDQTSTTAAKPVLSVDQADLSEEFINFIATIGAGNPIDTAAIGTYYGKVRVAVNGTFKYIALYNS